MNEAFFIPFLLVAGFMLLRTLRQVNQWEVGLRFTLGRLTGQMAPGLNFLLPVFQKMIRVDTRTRNRDLPQQRVITADNVTATIDAVVYFKVVDPEKATLAVQDRKTSRYLLFDEQLRLCGRQAGDERPELVRNCPQVLPLAFAGIHVISPRLLTMMIEDGAFSVVTTYLRLAAQEQKILAFRADEYYWRDLGKPENLAQAAEDIKKNVIALGI